MTKRPRVDFRVEAERCVQFLVAELGFAPPTYSDDILPHLVYEGEHLGYQVGYDPRDRVASTLVLKDRPDGGDRYHVSIVDREARRTGSTSRRPDRRGNG